MYLSFKLNIMKKWHVFTLILLFKLSFSVNSQEYQTLIKPDTTKWLFAHKQLAGSFIDTFFVGNRIDSTSIKLYYNGQFFNSSSKYAGVIRLSSNNDKIWYTSPTDTTENLIFNMNLKINDEFTFPNIINPAVVDSIYYIDGLKVIEFNISSDWNEPIKFIEGIGTNLTFAWYWSDPGFLSPILVCSYNLSNRIYSISNDFFSDECGLNTSSQGQLEDFNYRLYPNPFTQYLIVESSISLTERMLYISIHDILGKEVLQKISISNSRILINTEKLDPGIYLLKIFNNNDNKIYKILKQ